MKNEERIKMDTFEANIRVVGVGGGGTNAINRMVSLDVKGVEFIGINTDAQALRGCEADVLIPIGANLTRGLGAGNDPLIGREAAEEDRERIRSVLSDSDMVFVTAGKGGGTGTGAAPVVAGVAKGLGALTIGVVTRPFSFEGRRRAAQAEEGIALLKENCDTVIIIPNDRLLEESEERLSLLDAFRKADDVLRQGVQGITDLIVVPGLINVDFADVKRILSTGGSALMGIGRSDGDDRARQAAINAVTSPLLETSIEGAQGVLLSISGGKDTSLYEVNQAAETIAEAVDPDARIIFGAVVNESLEEYMQVTVVAAGLSGESRQILKIARSSKDREEKKQEKKETPESVVTFAEDDLDIPTFLRNR